MFSDYVFKKGIFLMKLGARIIKTGIAIVLSLLIASLLHLPTPLFAGIAAIFALQPTIYRSYIEILQQIQGNTIGAITAILFVLTFGNHVFIIGLAAIIVITINLKLKLGDSLSLSLVTMIAIMESPGDEFIEFAILRFLTIMLGVFVASFVNLIFLPPKYEKKLYYQISDITVEITKWIRLSTRHAPEHNLLRNDIEKLKDEIIKVDQLYLMFKEERNYFRRTSIVKSRKLVIYRQMISTAKRAMEILRELHRFENDLSHLPEEFHLEIQQHLDSSIDRHEQIMLKLIGKVRHQTINEDEKSYFDRKGLINLFLEQQKRLSEENELIYFHIMQILSSIIKYDEYLDHLDTLIISFKSFHKKENEVEIEDEIKSS